MRKHVIACSHCIIPNCGPSIKICKNSNAIFTITIESVFIFGEDAVVDTFKRLTGENHIIAELSLRTYIRYIKERLCQ